MEDAVALVGACILGIDVCIWPFCALRRSAILADRVAGFGERGRSSYDLT